MKKFRSSHGVEINDMMIAATSLNLEAKMISKNQKHYKFFNDKGNKWVRKEKN
tara:strand:+ start:677 stop:835 length:159 start_codon:yes stop_codon:yes gene_type:complete